MAAMEAATRVREALQTLNRADLKDPRLVEVLDLSQSLCDAMQAFFGSLDRSVNQEFRYIATYIARTRQEISALRPNDIKETRLPTAGAELDAIVKNTEEATHTIMGAAEAIMAADPTDFDAYQNLVNDKVLEIFQACSFQDITGQRVQKVVDTLRHIENRVARFAEVMGAQDEVSEDDLREKRKRELLLNGPALNGPETKQDTIDAFFAADGKADQSDIDALFA
jgi:chemotaxis protein CheZ